MRQEACETWEPVGHKARENRGHRQHEERQARERVGHETRQAREQVKHEAREAQEEVARRVHNLADSKNILKNRSS